MLLNHIKPKIEILLRKNLNGFRENKSTISQILTVRRILEGVKSINLDAVMLFVNFSKAFDEKRWQKSYRPIEYQRKPSMHHDPLKTQKH